MSPRPYKLIFFLLITSVLSILTLQGFWLRNFYIQKEDEFNSRVYLAMEKIVARIDERKGLKKLQHNVTIHKNSANTGAQNTTIINKSVVVSNYAQVQNREKKEDVEIRISDVNSIKHAMKNVEIGDSSMSVMSPNATIVTRTQTLQSIGKNEELDKLMNKMLMEIKIVDDDEKNPDTLNNIIKKVFENKGLFLPYEFALKKIFKNKDETLASSKGFNDKEQSFTTDLSANKVFTTHNYLMLQFPTRSSYVFASIQNMLVLSLVFSLVIIGAFYYTIRLILKQKKLSEMKNDFINNMTHELKTPIATISLATDAISNPFVKEDQEKFKDYTRILKEENQKLNTHVERVLEIAMLDKGELAIRKKTLDVVGLIKKAIETHKLLIEKKKASVNIYYDAEFAFDVDEEHMLAVFNNLLDNALKYSKEICTINIHVTKSIKALIISFKDNGIGIDKAQREKVFDKFYRVQSGNVHDVKGFGLGLSYVRSIIEAHNGTIELQSEKGKGSEFIIKFDLNA